MTALQRFLDECREASSLREMERRAFAQGHTVSAQRISQIINEPEPARLTERMVRALAAATGVPPLKLAVMEDEGFFLDRVASRRRRSVNE